MKTPWYCLCLALAAGCSSSSATSVDEVTTQKPSVQAEWAVAEAASSNSATEPPIQPIPDMDEPAAEQESQVASKPFPDDHGP